MELRGNSSTTLSSLSLSILSQLLPITASFPENLHHGMSPFAYHWTLEAAFVLAPIRLSSSYTITPPLPAFFPLNSHPCSLAPLAGGPPHPMPAAYTPIPSHSKWSMMAVGARQDIQTARIFPNAISGLVEHGRLAVGAEDFHVEDVGYGSGQACTEQYDAEPVSFATVTERRRGVGEELGSCEVVAARVWVWLRRDAWRKDCQFKIKRLLYSACRPSPERPQVP
ncbi:hypothetical protein KC338_g44 [Hortaea werneckii]|nr:hypothetical protein KC338_g44 [Hortaea werneckii]